MRWTCINCNEKFEAQITALIAASQLNLDDELTDVFSRQWEIRKQSKKLTGGVFPNENGVSRIKNFRERMEKGL
jgi:hypothetical protein